MPNWRILHGLTPSPADILRLCGERAFPIDVFAVSERLGINVYLNSRWSVEISAEINYVGLGLPEITVNANHSEIRQRFGVAHELGHAFLHLIPGVPANIPRDFDFRGSPAEVAANHFAAHLLVPFRLLQSAAAGYGWEIDMLAYLFQVSESVMEHRVREYEDVGR